MIQKPAFKSHLRIQVIPPDLVVFADESGQSGLKGNLFPLLAPLIDGTRRVEEIVDALADQHILDLHYALTLLEEGGYITEADDPRPADHREFGDALGIDPQTHQQRLEKTGVAVRSCGPVTAEPLERLLDRLQVRRIDDGDLLVVVTDDYLRHDLDAINQQALKTGRPWMPIKPVGSVLWLGPVFTPHRTACWSCLAERLRQNRPLEEFAALHHAEPAARPEASTSRLPSTTTALASARETVFGLAATEILRWVIDEKNETLAGTLLTVELADTTMKKHTVVRLAHCADCGASASGDTGGGRDNASGADTTGPATSTGIANSTTTCVPPLLETDVRQPLVDGGYRSVLPGRTLDRLAHHVSPLTGIVDDIRPLHDDDLLQVYSAGFPFPPGLRDRDFLDRGLRNYSTGKGLSREQARASALCEALERYSGVYRGRESRRLARYRDLGEAAIHPNDYMLFSAGQYERRHVLNESSSDWIPHPFEETRETDWSPLWSLTHETVRYLPTACCFYGYPCPPDHDFGRADSNGNAAGNTLTEAVLQGFMEVVERDAVALWWYNRIPRPPLDLDSFEHPYLSALTRYYRGKGRRFWVLDITSDLAIPAFAAVSIADGDESGETLLLGFGAHFDPVIGVMRAVTEMNQLLPTALRGVGRRMFGADLEDTDFLRPAAEASGRTLANYPAGPGDEIGQDVAACVRIAGERSMEVLVLEQTRPDVGLPVVKVVMPGMRPFWPRFAPGRLYEVPVELDWRGEPPREEDLNPSHLTI